MPGGGLSTIPVPGVNTNMNVPGGPGFNFEELLNKLRGAGRKAADVVGSPRGQAIAGVAAPLAYGAGSLMQGDIARGAGEIGGGLLGAKLAGGIASGLEAGGGARGRLAGAGVRAIGGLIGGGIGGGVAGRAANAAGVGAQGLMDAVTGQRREQGQSGLTGGGVGLDQLSGEQKQIAELARLMGVDIPAQQAAALMPYANQMKNADMQRQMQLNQQLGQLTGALNRQQYAFQLAGGAQSQAGENLRTMMTSNPYAASTFRY
jgi:hypothetical protein